MSHYQYFDELSGDSSNASCSSDDDDDDDEYSERSTMPRTILHADVDCFYGQCEILDRGLDPDRPLAIGQKHIVVTCNYAARAQGITKLMDRVEAQRRCPHLLIVEGSDLQRYRIHARKIYESFRKAVLALCPSSAVRKGSMDEMMAELSSTDLARIQILPFDGMNERDIFLCHEADKFHWTEDQSGAQAVVVPNRSQCTETRTNIHGATRRAAALLALQIRHTILTETGFTTTLGVSFNPMMAKLAIGFRKPGTVNLLEPEPPGKASFVWSLPLRSIPGIGSRTMKELRPCLEKHFERKDTASSPWLCGDLLQISYVDLVEYLENVPHGKGSSDDYGYTLLNLCDGLDESVIVDDEGGLQKTLSVENSMKRGTIRTREHVSAIMEDLYRRLPLLLKDRSEWSPHPTLAYPTVIRLTARAGFDGRGESRRFVVKSQQKKFDGRPLGNRNPSESVAWLRSSVTPLLQSLLFTSGSELNVTRLNLAVTNFQDLLVTPLAKHALFTASSPQQTAAKYSFQNNKRLRPTKILAGSNIDLPEHPETT